MPFRRSTDTELPKYGPGPDFPREVGRTEGLSPDTNYSATFEYLEPTPIVNPNYKVKYPYNKVTKYLAGHRMEFNNTPGNEYINIEHGEPEKVRMTMMNGGTMEIRQNASGGQGPSSGTSSSPTQGGSPGAPSFLHELKNGTYQRTVIAGNIVDTADDGVHLDKAKQQFMVGETLVQIRSQRGPIVIRAQGATGGTNLAPSSSQTIELIGSKILLNGDVVIDGDLKVRGSVGFSGEIQTFTETVTAKDESNDGKNKVESNDEKNTRLIGELDGTVQLAL